MRRSIESNQENSRVEANLQNNYSSFRVLEVQSFTALGNSDYWEQGKKISAKLYLSILKSAVIIKF